MSNVKIADQIRAKYVLKKGYQIKQCPSVRDIAEIIIRIPHEATKYEVAIIKQFYDLTRFKEKKTHLLSRAV